MSLLKNILQLIQEELEKQSIMNQSGDQKIINKDLESTEKYVQETQTNDDIIKRISKIENKISEIEKLQDLSIKNILQFDKNLKTLNEDFALIAKTITDILYFFNSIKIVNLDEDLNEDLDEDLNEKDKEESENDNSETIEDLDEFIKRNKKKYQ